MLRKLTPRERIALFVETWDAALRAAFLAVIDEIRSKITLRLVVEAMERRDLNAALDAMNIDREAFGPFETALADAFNAGGVMAAEDLNLREPDGSRIVFRFGVRNPEAEAWLRDHSSSLVTRIVDEQRGNIRNALETGLSRGDNPRTTALDIVGRVSRTSGTRTGGVVGLSAPHLAAVEKARQALSSGDVDGMRAYLALKTRDKRFDRTIAKAIRDGQPVPIDMATKIVGRLNDGYLKLRADTIALNETFTALASSRDEAMRQAIASGKVDQRDVTVTWKHTPQENPRIQHVQMAGQKITYGGRFVAPDGTTLRYPHDPEAPARHKIGCKCLADYSIDYTARLIRRRAN